MNEDSTVGPTLPSSLLGFLDGFEHHEAEDGDLISLHGWILGNGSRVQSVFIQRAKGTPVSVSYGLSRPDVAAAYPEKPGAATAGFAGMVTLKRAASHTDSPDQIEICVVLENGRNVSCFSRSLTVQRVALPAPVELRGRALMSSIAKKAVVAYRDGRLSFSPLKWFRDARYHYRASIAEQAAVRERFVFVVSPEVKQQVWDQHRLALESFFDSDSRLSWPQHSAPRVSVVLVLFNRAELTLHCLNALRTSSMPTEIIIVDNASTDETSRLLDRLDGVKILRKRERLRYALACNEAARLATGDYVLLLNDAEVLPGSLESAVWTLDATHDIGAVGAKIVLPDGRLQEAGGLVWNDGSCRGYGRGSNPRLAAYMYSRDVDYCSMVFLLTPRQLFLENGGLDDACRPMYYRDVDYCARLWESGKRVVFDPDAVVVHFEFENSAPEVTAETLPVRRRKHFVVQHAGWLAHKHSPNDANLLAARSAFVPRKRILVLDDRVPHFRHGAGFPRTVELLRILAEDGYFVTFYPVTIPMEDWPEVYDDIPRTVEVMIGMGIVGLDDFLRLREGFYDSIIVSRPHNMKTFRASMWKDGAWATRARVIYDAEAIFSFREAEQRRMNGETVTEEQVDSLLSEEMSLAKGVHAVYSVTDREREIFLKSGVGTVWVLGHTVDVKPSSRPFEERRGFVFVGAMGGLPNRDAVLWFCREIWPSVRAQVGAGVTFSVVGGDPPPEIRDLPGVDAPGRVADLWSYFDHARIFVAPSRLAAGVPIKVQTAAAYGVPIVCTSILAEELGWRDGVELLVADDPEEFAKCCARLYGDAELWGRLRMKALERVTRECSKQAFAETLGKSLA